MNREGYYTGIDRMRLIAAFLVIAIHTSPLADLGASGDFILTRVVARIAVPFFLMTTGYFTLSRYSRDDRKLLSFLKKTGGIYAAAILLYLPINIYNGYFAQPALLPNALRDIVFDGTLYHLWYLPASMLGMLISRLLVKKLDYKKGIAAAVLLYLIGLLGDSYYGIAERLPIMRNMYDLLFGLFDQTRNGIFYAPVFLMLGGLIAERKRRMTRMQSLTGFIVTLALMTGEALLLRRSGCQRHDSMYLLLLPCSVFLFEFVLQFRGKRVRIFRTASLFIYIIHPMMIVAVRAAARVMHLQALLVDNSMVHFVSVCAASGIFGFAAAAIYERAAVRGRHCRETERAYIELDLANLSHNAAVLQAAMPAGCELMAVVKTEAYGHGAYEISARLEKDGIKAFAVATVDEGISLRRYGIRGDILILGYTDVHRARELKKYRLTQTLIDGGYAERLNAQGVTVHVHIGIDSGMHRLGFDADDRDGVRRVFGMKRLRVDGIFTHLCCCESDAAEDVEFTREQISRFYALLDHLRENGISVPKQHIQSSYGLLNYPELHCDYVREGISLYGVNSSPQDKTKLHPELRPVLSLRARVALIRDVPAGGYVGYDRAYRAGRDSRIAILPIGYGDGYPRALSCGKGSVRIGEYTVPIIGRICMDQLAVDITDTDGISVGDIATLIDDCADSPLSAPNVAQRADSISNELLSRMGSRLPVVVKE